MFFIINEPLLATSYLIFFLLNLYSRSQWILLLLISTWDLGEIKRRLEASLAMFGYLIYFKSRQEATIYFVGKMNQQDHEPAIYKSLELHPMGPHCLWKILWCLPIQSKLKPFAQRISHNRLSTSAYLSSLMQDFNPQCICCRSAMESIDRLYTACPFSKHISTKIPTFFSKPISFTRFNDQFWSANVKDRIMEITFTWYIWKARNNYVFNYCPLHLNMILSTSLTNLLQWWTSHRFKHRMFNKIALPSLLWFPPLVDCLKLNFEGAYLSYERFIICGWYIQKSCWSSILSICWSSLSFFSSRI